MAIWVFAENAKMGCLVYAENMEQIRGVVSAFSRKVISGNKCKVIIIVVIWEMGFS